MALSGLVLYRWGEETNLLLNPAPRTHHELRAKPRGLLWGTPTNKAAGGPLSLSDSMLVTPVYLMTFTVA